MSQSSAGSDPIPSAPPARRRDFGTLRTETIVSAGLPAIAAARGGAERAERMAEVVLAAFDDHWVRTQRIPWLAKRAFERRDWRGAVELSQERIAIYSISIAKISVMLRDSAVVDLGAGFWERVSASYAEKVRHRYEADLAEAYLESLRRALHDALWRPAWPRRSVVRGVRPPFVLQFAAQGEMTPELARQVLLAPDIDAPFRDFDADAAAVSARINAELKVAPDRPLERIEAVSAGFFRNRGAYVVGAAQVAGVRTPMAVALLNRDDGLETDAVVLQTTSFHHLFSSTLANFHVAVPNYHELVDYLYELCPLRPHGQHYSTVGYNHVGKIAVMEQISAFFAAHPGRFDHAPGPRGSVAMAFTADALPFVLKVIRDQPTDQYKWDRFDGVDSVLKKYRRVHEINRSGSMLDNLMYAHLQLPRALFAEDLLEELTTLGAETVEVQGDQLYFRHLIVQLKMTPLPLFLQDCSPKDAELVTIRLGQCIRNNAATNVFNKDLDGRNYGVSRQRFVYLFDYDAVETLTDVKVRTNAEREPGEEDVPDWFFEDGVIFLPEEMEAHLRLPTRDLRRLFREAHGEILTADWWLRMQDWLREGRVPRVRTYPRAAQLRLDRRQNDLTLSPLSESGPADE